MLSQHCVNTLPDMSIFNKKLNLSNNAVNSFKNNK